MRYIVCPSVETWVTVVSIPEMKAPLKLLTADGCWCHDVTTLKTRRALRERRPPPRPSPLFEKLVQAWHKHIKKKWKLLSWQLNNSNFMELSDRIYEAIQMMLLQVSGLTRGEISWNRLSCHTKCVAMATMMVNFKGFCKELLVSASHKALSQIEVEKSWPWQCPWRFHILAPKILAWQPWWLLW